MLLKRMVRLLFPSIESITMLENSQNKITCLYVKTSNPAEDPSLYFLLKVKRRWGWKEVYIQQYPLCDPDILHEPPSAFFNQNRSVVQQYYKDFLEECSPYQA